MVERAQISKTAKHVTVACKLPNGLFLQLWRQVDSQEMTSAGPRPCKVSVKKGEAIKLPGTALRFGETPEFPLPGGYSLTQVPADFWEEWCVQNADSDLLANRILFAHDSQDKAADQAREQKKEKVTSGMEPIDPKNPPRVGPLKVIPAEA